MLKKNNTNPSIVDTFIMLKQAQERRTTNSTEHPIIGIEIF
jgi:hypothetical protein